MTLQQLVQNRLPDEAAIFAASLSDFIQEAQALAGYEGTAEEEISTPAKSLIADLAAKAMLIPARSHYKKEMNKVEGDQAGKAEFVDKLKFLDAIEKKLDESIELRRRGGLTAVDSGVPMVVVIDCD